MSGARVLVVEDDARLHEMVEELLRGEGYRLSFAATAAQARAHLHAGAFDVLLVDLGLPDANGIDLIREVHRGEAGQNARCLVMTSASTRWQVLAALRAGACGYLVKEDLALRLAGALRDVLAGGMPMSAAAAAYVLERLRQDAPSGLSPSPTPRERETLALLARGLTYAQIGEVQGVSINTVRSHVSAAYAKLQAANKAEAVMLALQEGWIER